MKPKTSLHHRGERFADATEQLVVLAPQTETQQFQASLTKAGISQLTANRIEILQVNLGKLCNMTCDHCHVDAGPDRREIMQRSEIDACLQTLENNSEIKTLDLTGGAPEMNPHFCDLVTSARELGCHVIDRCNLTILLAKGYEHLPEFLAANSVEIVASLPCYLEENTDSQRGDGAFSKSIEALLKLNSLGYGKTGTGLTLTLVYNPVGSNLPPAQSDLELAYRRELRTRFGIEFDRLFTITNMPVSRYLDFLIRTGDYSTYMEKLINAFNPAAVSGLMCRNTLSVGWDGQLYDCDFNQMLELSLNAPNPTRIQEFQYDKLINRPIQVAQHCFGCTAGAGSGCQGSIT
jgi:radical SAM/Cys-rich protein